MLAEISIRLHKVFTLILTVVPEMYPNRLKSVHKYYVFVCLLASYLAKIVLRRAYSSLLSNILATLFLAKYSLDDVTKITNMADKKHIPPSCHLVALPSQAFYGAEFTIQQCNTLRLVVIRGQLILTSTLFLS